MGVSEYVTREARNYGAEAVKIYNGCNLERFYPTYKDEGYILSVGELISCKSFEVPIKISRVLKIVGIGPERRSLENYARRIGADVEFLGLVLGSNLVELYQKCSFFVSGSFYESFGIVFLEANACGKPVIARDCTAMPEIVKHNETGFLCNNDRDFIFYSDLLWKNKKTRRVMGIKARKHAESFSWSKTATKYDEIIVPLTC